MYSFHVAYRSSSNQPGADLVFKFFFHFFIEGGFRSDSPSRRILEQTTMTWCVLFFRQVLVDTIESSSSYNKQTLAHPKTPRSSDSEERRTKVCCIFLFFVRSVDTIGQRLVFCFVLFLVRLVDTISKHSPHVVLGETVTPDALSLGPEKRRCCKVLVGTAYQVSCPDSTYLPLGNGGIVRRDVFVSAEHYPFSILKSMGTWGNVFRQEIC
jgi:hypothetical protein